MNFQEAKNILVRDLNNESEKCYNNPGKLMTKYAKKKDMIQKFVEATSFIDEYNIPFSKKSSHLAVRFYCLLNDIDSYEKYPKCPLCGKPKGFKNLVLGHIDTCGANKCFQNYGDINTRRHQTAKNKFGSLKAAYHDTAKKTIQEKYGVDSVSKLEEVKEKKIQTSLKNWGTEHPWQSEKGKKIHLNAVQDKYGVDNISQLDEVKQKKIQTSLKNWGYENPSQSPIILQKIIETWINKYGVENISQCLKIHRKKIEKSCTEYVTESGKKFLYEGNEIIFLEKFIKLYGEENIYPQPELYIEYYDEDFKYRVWFPDFHIIDKQKEIMAECKVLWNLHKSITSSNKLKHKLLTKNEKYQTRLYIHDDTIESKTPVLYQVDFKETIRGDESWEIKSISNKKTSIFKLKHMLIELGFKNVTIFDPLKF